MILEKNSISSTQLTILMLSFIQGGIFTLAYVAGLTVHDKWIAVAVAILITIVLSMLYVSLARQFPKKSLVQIHELVYGRFLGAMISVLYILFFMLILGANLWYMGSFWTNYLMQETPRAAFVILFAFICIWVVKNGLEVLARSSFFIVVTMICIVSITTILLLKKMRISNFLPIFEVPFTKFIQAVHILVAIPFCEIVVFLMIFSQVNKPEQIKRSVLASVISGGIFLLVVAIRDIAVLGPIGAISNSPNFIAIRQIKIGEFLTRLDILVAIGVMLTLFIKISVFLYAAVLGIAQMLRLPSYKTLIIPIGIIVMVMGLNFIGSDMEQAYHGMNNWPFFATFFEVILPVLTLIVSKIRGISQKEVKQK